MRVYFAFGYLAVILVVLGLGKLLTTSLIPFWQHIEKNILQFLLPVIITVALALTFWLYFMPFTLDALQIVQGNYNMSSVKLTAADIKKNYLQIREEKYFLPTKKSQSLKPGTYQVYYTNHLKYVMRLKKTD